MALDPREILERAKKQANAITKGQKVQGVPQSGRTGTAGQNAVKARIATGGAAQKQAAPATGARSAINTVMRGAGNIPAPSRGILGTVGEAARTLTNSARGTGAQDRGQKTRLTPDEIIRQARAYSDGGTRTPEQILSDAQEMSRTGAAPYLTGMMRSTDRAGAEARRMAATMPDRADYSDVEAYQQAYNQWYSQAMGAGLNALGQAGTLGYRAQGTQRAGEAYDESTDTQADARALFAQMGGPAEQLTQEEAERAGRALEGQERREAVRRHLQGVTGFENGQTLTPGQAMTSDEILDEIDGRDVGANERSASIAANNSWNTMLAERDVSPELLRQQREYREQQAAEADAARREQYGQNAAGRRNEADISPEDFENAGAFAEDWSSVPEALRGQLEEAQTPAWAQGAANLGGGASERAPWPGADEMRKDRRGEIAQLPDAQTDTQAYIDSFNRYADAALEGGADFSVQSTRDSTGHGSIPPSLRRLAENREYTEEMLDALLHSLTSEEDVNEAIQRLDVLIADMYAYGADGADYFADALPALEAARGQLDGYGEYYARLGRYNSMPYNADFATMSEARPTGERPGVNAPTVERLYWWLNDIDGYQAAPNAEGYAADVAGSLWERDEFATDELRRIGAYVTPEQLETFNYIFNSESPDAAQVYLDDVIMRTVNAEHSTELQAWRQEEANISPVMTTLMSYPAQLAGSLFQGVSYAGDLFGLLAGTGDRPMDPNSAAATVMQVNAAGREQVGENIKEALGGGTLGTIGKVLYDGFNGFVDNWLIRGATGAGIEVNWRSALNGVISGATKGRVRIGNGDGFSSPLSSMYYFWSGFGDAAQNAAEKGATPEQILINAIGSGANELIFETFSLEKLINMSDAGTLGGVLMNLFKQVFTESSEEFFTFVADSMVNELSMGYNSDLAVRQRELRDEGYTEEEASIVAANEWWAEAGQTALMGGLEGGFSALGHQAGNILDIAGRRSAERRARRDERRQNRETGRRIFGNNSTQAMTDMARAMKDNKRVQDALAKYTRRMTERNAGELYRALRVSLGEKNSAALREAVQADVRAALEAMGGDVSEDVVQAMEQLVMGNADAEAVAKISEDERGMELFRQMQKAGALDRSINVAKEARENYDALVAMVKKPGTEESDTESTADERAPDENPDEMVVVMGRDVEQSMEKANRVTRKEGNTTFTTPDGTSAEANTVRLDPEETMRRGVPVFDLTIQGRDDHYLKSITEIEAGDDIHALAAYEAANYGKLAGAVYTNIVNLINQGMSEREAVGLVAQAYNYGQIFMSNKTAMERLTKTAGMGATSALQLAYDLGRTAGRDRLARGLKTNLAEARVNTDLIRGRLQTGNLSEQQISSIRAMIGLAKAMGLDIVLYESRADGDDFVINDQELADALRKSVGDTAPNGAYFEGKLYIDINAGRDVTQQLEGSMMRTLAHELTHFIKENGAEDAWMRLQQFVVDSLEEGRFEINGRTGNFDQLVRDYMQDLGLTYDAAVEEVVADACEMMLQNTTVITQMAEKEPGVFAWIRGWVHRWAEFIKKAFTGVDAQKEPARYMMKHAEQLQKLWDDAAMSTLRRREEALAKAAREKAAQQADVDRRHRELMDRIYAEREAAQTAQEPVVAETQTAAETDEPDFIDLDIPDRGPSIERLRENPDTPIMLTGTPDIKAALGVLAEELGLQTVAAGRGHRERIEYEDGTYEYIGYDRHATRWVEMLLDDYGLKYEQIEKAAAAIAGNDVRRIKRMRPTIVKVEHVLDEMASTGFTSYMTDEPERWAYTDEWRMIKTAMAEQQQQETAAEEVEQAVDKGLPKRGTTDLTEGSPLAVLTEAYGTDGKPLLSSRSLSEDRDDILRDMRNLKDEHGHAIMTKAEIDNLQAVIDYTVNQAQLFPTILDHSQNVAREGRPYTPVKMNADPHYKAAIDYTTMCRKRIFMQAVVEKLEGKLNMQMSTATQIAIRNKIQQLQREGRKLDVACAICYVEAARMNTYKWVNTFLDNKEEALRTYFAKKDKAWKNGVLAAAQRQFKLDRGYAANATKDQMKAQKPGGIGSADVKALEALSQRMRREYQPANAEQQQMLETIRGMDNNQFLTASNLARMAQDESTRLIYDAYMTYIREHARSKALEQEMPYYHGDLLGTRKRGGKSYVVNAKMIARMNLESGMRFKSWSDFMAKYITDEISAIVDLSLAGAKAHAYTKVPAYVDFAGNTGLMLNMSMIPKGETGLDANGNLVDDPVEGMAMDVMNALRDKYPNTAGNIWIGVSDAQIRKLMESPDVDYIIPYHTSGASSFFQQKTGIKAWGANNYQLEQNESKDNRSPVTSKKKAPALREWFNIKDAQNYANGYDYMNAAQQRYLDLCAERGLIPKFHRFVERTEQTDASGKVTRVSYTAPAGYWKMLVDRKMVNHITGQIIEQQVVKPIFDDATIKRIVESEIKEHSRVLEDEQYAMDAILQAVERGELEVTAEDMDKGEELETMALNYGVQESYRRGAEEAAAPHFDMRRPVEQSGNLVALHNMTDEKLDKALRLGGLPAPSVAVTKASIGHRTFGDISLVFGRETIDPQADRRNNVFSADAWTPIFPRVEYKANEKAANRIYRKLTDLGQRLDPYFADKLKYYYSGDDEARLNRYGGTGGLVERALDDIGMKAAFLADTGRSVESVKRAEEAANGYSASRTRAYEQILDELGADTVEAASTMSTEEVRERYGSILEAALPGSTKMNLVIRSLLRQTLAYSQRNSDNQAREVIDEDATRNAIDERVNGREYRAWLENLFEGLEERSGIRNGRDLYTASGNRRSFESTHYPVSVENIARAMSEQNGGDIRNVSGFNGSKTLRAATAERFGSVEAMHRSENRLQDLTQNEIDERTSRLNDRLFDLLGEVANGRNFSWSGNAMMELDNLGMDLEEIARKKYTPASIRATFQKYGYTISQETAESLKALLDEIKNMPVNMYEAKPMRAVYFDEVKYAIVPDDMNPELRTKLEQAVGDVRTYERGNEAQRLEVLNSLEGVRFSERTGPRNTPTEELPAYTRREVEEGRNLIAVHNISADKLLRSAGTFKQGMPSPSIAIMDIRRPNLAFGNISFVLDKRSVLPEFQGNARNWVFGGDAYTASMPNAYTGEDGRQYIEEARFYDPYEGRVHERALDENSAVFYEYYSADDDDYGRRYGTRYTNSGLSIGAAFSRILTDYNAIKAEANRTLRGVGTGSIARSGALDSEYRNVILPRLGVEANDADAAREATRAIAEAFDAGIANYDEPGQAGSDDREWALETISERLQAHGFEYGPEDAQTMAVLVFMQRFAQEYERNYFEAKREGVVNWDELKYALIPADAAQYEYGEEGQRVKRQVIDFLTEKGIRAIEYANDEDKMDILQALPEQYETDFAEENARHREEDESRYYSTGMEDGKLLFSERRRGTTARELLVGALKSAAVNDGEMKMLESYQKRIDELNTDQRKLAEITRRVQDMTTGAVPMDKDEMTKAQNRIKILRDRIQRADSRLMTMEATAPLKAVMQRRLDQVREQERERVQRANERLNRWRADRSDTISRANMRREITRTANRLTDMLRNPTDQRHVPQGLQDAMSAFVSVFDGKQFDAAQIQNLIEQYRTLGPDGVNAGTGAGGLYDSDVLEMLERLRDEAGGRSMIQLNVDQLKMLRDVVRHFSFITSRANEIFVNGRREQIDEIAQEANEEAAAKGLHREHALNKNALWRLMSTGQMTPIYFFRRIGGQIGELGEAILEGENKYGTQTQKSKNFFADVQERHHYRDWANKKNDTLTFETATGHTITLTREQALGLYATDKREKANKEQRASHLETGGVVFEQKEKQGRVLKYTTAQSEAMPIVAADMAKINEWLTDEQKAYADEIVGYLSNDMARLGNETAMRLYGYEKFGEGYYFPYRTSSDFRATKLGESESAMLKSMSFTKRLVRMANNPIVISDFTMTAANHVNQMILYTSFAEAQDNFMRVYDHKLAANRSVKSAFGAAWGKNATEYITQLMQDVYGGVTRDRTDQFADKATSLFKKGSVMANLSVAIQQPSAIMRAMAYVNPKYFIGKGVGGWNELKQYAGTAVIKDIGGFDTNVGAAAAEWIANDYRRPGGNAVMEKIDEVGGKMPEMMDRVTWCAMWQAIKRETADRMHASVKDENVLRAAGERFDEVMRLTQVYDSTLAKSQNMRSKSAYSKMITSFMAEPTVGFNMLVDAFTRKDHSNKFRGRALAAFIAAAVFNAMLKGLPYAMRASGKKENEDKTLLELYVAEVLGSLTGNKDVWFVDSELSPANMIPWVRDIISVAGGYDVNRSDMNVITEAYKAFQTAMDGNKTPYERIMAIAGGIGQVTGIPFKNVRRDIESIVSAFQAKPVGETTAEGIRYAILGAMGYDDTKSSNARALVAAYMDGDGAEVDSILLHMTGYKGWSEKDTQSAVQAAAKRAYLSGDLDAETAARLIMDYGTADDENEAYWAIDRWDFDRSQEGTPEEERETYSRYRRLFQALAGDGNIDEEIAFLESHGVRESTIRSNIKTWIRTARDEGTINDAEAGRLLQRYTGTEKTPVDEDDVYWTLQGWDANLEEGESFSRYDRLDTALETGTGIDAAMEELRGHGYDDSSVKSHAVNTLKGMFLAGTMSWDTAVQRMRTMFPADYNTEQDVHFLRRRWEYEGETGESTGSDYCYVYHYIDQGDDASLRTELASMERYGKKRSNMATAIVNHYEPIYRELMGRGDTAGARALQQNVIRICGYLGVNKQKAVSSWGN